jgi:hypothetical protein
MVTQASNPNTQEAEAGGLQILGQPRLHGETVLKEIKANKLASAT